MFENIYQTGAGRFAARLLATPFISYIAGAFMNSKASKFLIKGFAKKNNLDLGEAKDKNFKSFNAFFTRRLKDGLRPVCTENDALVSPSDGLLSVYDIDKDTKLNIKGHVYTLCELCGGTDIAESFGGGQCLVFRLTPSHYHRYIWPCDGRILDFKRIKGIYHTVRPTALENVKVFKTNTREYALCETSAFGRLIIMEVGALLVGRIVNHIREGEFQKGEEKGYFEFGGSTIVLITQSRLLPATNNDDNEIPVKAGQRLN